MSHKPQLHQTLERGTKIKLTATNQLVSARNNADDFEDWVLRLQPDRNSITADNLPALLSWVVNFTTIENYQTAKFEQWNTSLSAAKPLPIMGVAIQGRGTEVFACLTRNASAGSLEVNINTAVIPGTLQEYIHRVFVNPPGIVGAGNFIFEIPWFASEFQVLTDAPAGDTIEQLFPSGLVLQASTLTDVSASVWQPVHPLADRIRYTNNGALKVVILKFRCWS